MLLLIRMNWIWLAVTIAVLILLAVVPKKKEKKKWLILWWLLFLVSLVLQVRSALQAASLKRAIVDLGRSTKDLSDYGEIARLNVVGMPPGALEGIFTTAPYRGLQGTYKKVDANTYNFHCDEEAEAKFKAVADSFTDFPFAMALYAQCAHDRGNSDWHSYAIKAREILKKTTAIKAHHPHHDRFLAQMEDLLKN